MKKALDPCLATVFLTSSGASLRDGGAWYSLVAITSTGLGLCESWIRGMEKYPRCGRSMPVFSTIHLSSISSVGRQNRPSMLWLFHSRHSAWSFTCGAHIFFIFWRNFNPHAVTARPSTRHLRGSKFSVLQSINSLLSKSHALPMYGATAVKVGELTLISWVVSSSGAGNR